MIRFRLRDLLAGAGGTLLSGALGAELFSGVSTDSRTLRPGEVFFALRGPRHDGHRFLRQAQERGAALAVIEARTPAAADLLPALPLVVVEDTLRALQSFAAWWRGRHAVTLLAVVGSAGKTTTKEMAAALLSTLGPCHRTEGNLNNQIGVALTLLGLEEFHRFAVVELASNAPGEILFLGSLARPSAAILTRIGWAHLEGFGSPGKLLEEKASILSLLPSDGWCALNADDENFAALAKKAPGRVVPYGFSRGEVRAREISLGEETTFVLQTPAGSERVHLAAFGRHFVENALAAVAGTLPLGFSLEEAAAALGRWEPPAGRGVILEAAPGVRFIDDTYNANPLSMAAALESLSAFRARGVTVAVLGGMRELGDWFHQGHLEVGRKAAETGIDWLVGVGEEASLYAEGAAASGMDRSRIRICPDHRSAAEALAPFLVPGTWVLFKGSRAARTEDVMEAFLPRPALAKAGGR